MKRKYLAAAILVMGACNQSPTPMIRTPNSPSPRPVREIPDTTWLKEVFVEGVVDQKPALVFVPPPQYPDSLRRAGVQGVVVLEFVIDTTGHVEPGSVRVLSSAHPGFSASAREAILRAQFRPARVGGRAVRVLVNQPVQFSIRAGER